jgi:hypothetical protein
MRPSLLTIMGLTLIATAWGCASSGTTNASTSKTTVGLKSLDADVVLSGTTPEVREGKLGVEQRPIASRSGLWMDTKSEAATEDDWQQPGQRFDRIYKLVLPPDPNDPQREVASLRDRRSARQ